MNCVVLQPNTTCRNNETTLARKILTCDYYLMDPDLSRPKNQSPAGLRSLRRNTDKRPHLPYKDVPNFQGWASEMFIKRCTKQYSEYDVPDSLDKVNLETFWQIEDLPNHAEPENLPEIWEWPPRTLTQSQVLVKTRCQLLNFIRESDEVW